MVAFGLAVAIPLCTAALQGLLLPSPTVAPFVALFPAVILVAWLGGLAPGLVAVAVAASSGNYLLIAPTDAFNPSGPGLVSTLLFAVSAAAAAVLAGSLRQAMSEAEDRADLLQRYQVLVRHTRDIVLFVRAADGRILEANDAAVQAYGYPRQELLARTLEDLRAPDRGQPPDRLADARLQGGFLEAVHRRKDGSTLDVEVSSSAIELGGTRTLVSVVRDISERKRAEQELLRSEQRVRLKLESILSPEGDIGTLELADLIDLHELQALLESFCALTHVPAAIVDVRGNVLVGVGWQESCTSFHRVHPETRAHCVESDTELTAGIVPGTFRLYRCKNGLWDAATPILVGDRHIANAFTGQFFLDDEVPDREFFESQARRCGFPVGEYLASIDRVPRLTRDQADVAMAFLAKLAHMLSRQGYANVKLARALTEREALTDSLRESDRRKNDFLSMLSHELRNPLTPVRNSVFLLQRAGGGTAQAQRALAVIDRQTAHLSKLIDDLLDVTRISHGKVRLQKERLDANALLARVSQDMASTFADAGIRVELRLAEEPLWVDADETRIAQVIGNLLRNASKFTDRGGSTTLSASVDAGACEVVLRVRDSGIGIPAAVLQRLFEPFVQAETTLDRAKGGLGLGLAVARSLVVLHGGRLTVASDGEGRGAEFSVHLPLAGAPPEPVAERPPAISRVGRRILLIEDLADAAETLREALEVNGHTVSVASSGPEGIEKARALRPDAILCDIGLPGMDGYAVARAIRADPQLRTVFLVALTGYASSKDQRSAAEAGFDLHLAKPPEVEAIERALAGARAMPEAAA